MVTKIFIGLFLALPSLLKAASVASNGQKYFSVAQLRRYDYDHAPGIRDFTPFDMAHIFLESVVVESDPESVRAMKRDFLTRVDIIGDEKLRKKKKFSEDYLKGQRIIFNYPTVQEALELCFPELTAKEAASFARAYPGYFFRASPAVLEAIPDYSEFTVQDLKLEARYRLEGFLLDIENAVRTLPIMSLIQSMENASFELNPRQQELIKCRIPELLSTARNDPRLVYQFALLYDDKTEAYDIESVKNLDIDIDFSVSAPAKSGKSKKKGKAKTPAKESLLEVFDFGAESPASHSLFGNLISVGQIIALKPQIAEASWKMLAISYAVYTNTLMEHIFGAIHRAYPQFVGYREATFVAFHKLLIDDLKKIVQERSKLLAVCKDENLKLLLSVPLSKQVRDALAAVNEETKDILITQPVTPYTLHQWLWAQVIPAKSSDFSFQVKSTMEIYKALENCFCLDDQFARFRGGYVVSVFFHHLLFGLPESSALTHEIKSYYIINALYHVENFGGFASRFPDLVSPKAKFGPAFKASFILASCPFTYHNLNDIDRYEITVEKRNALQQLLQFTMSPATILEALKYSSEPEIISGGISTFKAEYLHFYSIVKAFPEILGNHNWENLIANDFCPEEFLENFTGNMIRYHGDAITLPPLDSLSRGLYAVPLEKVKQFLRDSNFMVTEPLRIMDCVNPQLFTSYAKEASEESIEFFNMMTPWLHHADPITLKNFKFAETLITFVQATGNCPVFFKAVFNFLLRVEMNHLLLKADTDFESESFLQQVFQVNQVEVKIRKNLIAFIKFEIKGGLEGEEEYVKQLFIDALKFVSFGPISPSRAFFNLELAKKFKIMVSREQNIEVINNIQQFLTALEGLTAYRGIGSNMDLNEIAADAHKFAETIIKAARLTDPGNEFNELLFWLSILESGTSAANISSDRIPAEIFRKAVAGYFKCKVGATCELIAKKLYLNFENGEFVTQDLAAIEADSKEFRRQQIIKNLEASRKKLEKK